MFPVADDRRKNTGPNKPFAPHTSVVAFPTKPFRKRTGHSIPTSKFAGTPIGNRRVGADIHLSVARILAETHSIPLHLANTASSVNGASSSSHGKVQPAEATQVSTQGVAPAPPPQKRKVNATSTSLKSSTQSSDQTKRGNKQKKQKKNKAKRSKASKPRKTSAEYDESNPATYVYDCNMGYCGKCRGSETGDLLCCDACPNAFHPKCINLQEIPPGDWHCSW